MIIIKTGRMAPAQIDTSGRGGLEEAAWSGRCHKKTGVIFTRHVKIRMRDGVDLMANVFRRTARTYCGLDPHAAGRRNP
jgi:predicted acyl esterase